MTYPPVQYNAIGPNTYQAMQGDSDDVFVIRQTTHGWKTEGHRPTDGLLCTTLDELVAVMEGREQ